MAKKSVAGTPADPTVKFAKMALDGREWLFSFDFNAIAIAEAHTATNLFRALSHLGDLSAAQFRGLLYAALLKAHPELTVEQAGSLIRIDTMGPLQETLAEAYILSLPEQKKENPPQPE